MKTPEEINDRYEGGSVHVSKGTDTSETFVPVPDASRHFGSVLTEDGQGRSGEQRIELHKQATLTARQANEGLLKKIAQLEQTEKELLESNERLRSIVESAHDPIVGADSQGRIIRWNPAAVRTFGYTEEDVLNQPVSILISDPFATAHEAAIQRAVASGSLYYSKRVREVSGRRKDGSEFPAEVSISAWKTRDGMFFTAIIRDITERKQRDEELRKAYAELELRVAERTAELVKLNADLKQEIKERERAEEMARTSERLYHALVEEVPDVIFVLDNAGRFTYLNIQAEQMLGRPLGDILETSITWYVVPEEREKILSILDLSPDSIWDEEVRLSDASGETKYARIRCKAVVQADERNTCFEGVMRDISRRKRLEDQLRESREQLLEKIQIIDELYAHIVESGKARAIAEHTAEVAHELRQPLTIIGGFARRIERQLDSHDIKRSAGQASSVRIISTEIQRLERILNTLLDFTRRETVSRKMANPNDIIGRVCALYQSVVHEKSLTLDCTFRPEVEEILLDTERFEQVVRNLISNAVEASPVGQAIHVETGISLPSSKALEAADLESEGYFEMKVQNHGPVIKEEDLQRIFSPFYTTKHYGAGIGLTVSKKIVEAHNGSISVQSDERGTTFTVWLPLNPRQAGLERLTK